MDKKATAIGIDVGKHKLDVALIIEGKVGSKSVANSSAGYQELTAWMTWQNVELDSCLVSTVNRDIAAIRAALNFSLAKGHVTTDVAWKAPPPTKHSGKLVGGHPPGLLRHLPIFFDIAQGQIQQFGCCLVAREVATLLSSPMRGLALRSAGRGRQRRDTRAENSRPRHIGHQPLSALATGTTSRRKDLPSARVLSLQSGCRGLPIQCDFRGQRLAGMPLTPCCAEDLSVLFPYFFRTKQKRPATKVRKPLI